MQENTTVGWDPVLDRHLPLSSKLFVLYVFIVITVSLVRWIRLLRQLWWLKTHPQSVDSHWLSIWNHGLATIQASKRLVVVTCFLSVAVTAIQTRTLLAEIASQKFIGIGFLYGGLAAALVNLEIGLWVGVAIYVAFAFCEGVLLLQWDRVGDTSQRNSLADHGPPRVKSNSRWLERDVGRPSAGEDQPQKPRLSDGSPKGRRFVSGYGLQPYRPAAKENEAPIRRNCHQAWSYSRRPLKNRKHRSGV
jgi:hypothetical protein